VREGNIKERTNEGLIGSTYSEIPSEQRCVLDLRWTMHDVHDVDGRDFRSGAYLWANHDVDLLVRVLGTRFMVMQVLLEQSSTFTEVLKDQMDRAREKYSPVAVATQTSLSNSKMENEAEATREA